MVRPPSPLSSVARLFGRGGCLFVLVTCVGSLLLLAVDNAIVDALYSALAPGGPNWLKRRWSAQFILFAGPVLLLFLQWWLFELVLATLWSGRRRGRGSGGGASD